MPISFCTKTVARSITFDKARPHVPLESESLPRSYEDQSDRIALKLLNKHLGSPQSKYFFLICGPPGSGKTTRGTDVLSVTQERKRAVPISYDEGLIDLLPGYARQQKKLAKELRDAKSDSIRSRVGHLFKRPRRVGDILDDRLKCYGKYRADAQYTRAIVLNQAIEDGRSVCVDITGAGKGTIVMLKGVKEKHGYERREAVGLLASAETSAKRIDRRRAKVIEPKDVYTKRYEFLNNLPDLVKHTELFALHLNDVDGAAPRLVARYHNGILVGQDGTATADFEQILKNDCEHFDRLLQASVKAAELSNEEMQTYHTAYRQAVDGLSQRLQLSGAAPWIYEPGGRTRVEACQWCAHGKIRLV